MEHRNKQEHLPINKKSKEGQDLLSQIVDIYLYSFKKFTW